MKFPSIKYELLRYIHIFDQLKHSYRAVPLSTLPKKEDNNKNNGNSNKGLPVLGCGMQSMSSFTASGTPSSTDKGLPV